MKPLLFDTNSLLFHLIFFFSFIVPETSPIINTFKNLSSTSVLLSWDPPVKPNGAIISYDLTLQGPSENYSFVTSDNYVILDELSPFTLYSFFAAARTIKGLGPSSVLFFYTDESGKPESVFLPMILLLQHLLFLRKSMENERIFDCLFVTGWQLFICFAEHFNVEFQNKLFCLKLLWNFWVPSTKPHDLCSLFLQLKYDPFINLS